MKYRIFIVSLLFLSLLFINAFLKKPFDGEKALVRINSLFNYGLKNTDQAIANFYEAITKYKWGEISEQTLQERFSDIRENYKRIEYLVEYFDPEGVKKLLNGPPLKSVEKGVPEVNIIEPTGLQVLDELIFLGKASEDLDKIEKLTLKLKRDFASIKNHQLRIAINHRHVFEAIRLEIIRIFTLGLTGFDTPGSANGINESLEALKGIASALEAYYPGLMQKDKSLADQLRYALEDAIYVLATESDFENFDRLSFLKRSINPIFKYSLQAQKVLGIESFQEATDGLSAINWNAENIFSEDLFNIGYYANIDLQNEKIAQRKALGASLFYDPILSKDQKMSCATCHDPKLAFSDGKKTSLDNPHLRNAPGLINAVLAEKYFYDNRESNLERQVNHVVKADAEFNTTFPEIIQRLKSNADYKKQFEIAYSDQPQFSISKWSISDAIASYVASLVSFNSPFDKYVRNEIETISPEVKSGFNLFMGKAACSACHFAPTFAGLVPPLYKESETEVLGVPKDPHAQILKIDDDLGRIKSGLPLDKAGIYKNSFKTTTVRNVQYTHPYMHNGAYDNLLEVLEFYNEGGGAGLGMEIDNQTLPESKLNLTKKEMRDLKAFMNALSEDISIYANDGY